MVDESISLEKYIDVRCASIEAVIEARFDALQRAVDLAEHRLEGKLAAMNEWRALVNDRAAEFAQQAQVTRIQAWIDRAGGRWQALTIGSGVLSIVTLLLTLARMGYVR